MFYFTASGEGEEESEAAYSSSLLTNTRGLHNISSFTAPPNT